MILESFITSKQAGTGRCGTRVVLIYDVMMRYADRKAGRHYAGVRMTRNTAMKQQEEMHQNKLSFFFILSCFHFGKALKSSILNLKQSMN
jgi:hypothetical protein